MLPGYVHRVWRTGASKNGVMQVSSNASGRTVCWYATAYGRQRASSVAGRRSSEHARHQTGCGYARCPSDGSSGAKTQVLLGQRLRSWLKTYLQSRRYKPHIQSRKEESETSKNTEFKAYHWVVERTHSWMNRFRRVLTRWEKKTENYEAMLHFACGLIVWNKVLLR